MTIGSADDLRAMQFEDVQAFFRTYYHPSNASLVLAGDIDAERGFDLAEQYFGDLARRQRVRPASTATRRARRASSGCVLEDRVELPRVYMAWHSPAMFADWRRRSRSGRASCSASGKMSRLYRRLVYERADGGRRLGASELARAGQLLSDRGDGGAGTVADRGGWPCSTTRLQRLVDERPDRRRDGAGDWRRPKHTSSIACRPSAASAASRIS